ncbi:Fpg/Nei family DNA glycosylase [Corynebacterium epidermidicanis]|uniref:DNA-(apurinic or apyrimidinic site) lyase n=1 Tax=Corynebacterium epidermidicanis TaxID=1050174 RepID=A0A0G3GUR2_9CORY|nr:DNA-formamidopyrimidine glycosylase family protein [Corynebacterium epidermidicanis]AKK04245.1 formamidopyrimidine-DNA glycosylase [Corynebacterium epidermidicanis]
MPEGHVIHRLARDLNSAFTQTTPQVSSPQGRFATEAAQLDQQTFIGADAHGKHLFITFDHPLQIHIHLGLIGKFHLSEPKDPTPTTRLRIANDHTTADLIGPQWCRLITEDARAHTLAKLGADPLREDADPEWVWTRVHRSNRTIGSLLMDQKLFAGVGNIYRAEPLFRLGISPFLPGKQLSRPLFDALWTDLTELMADGVTKGRIDTIRPEHTPEAMGRPPRKDDHGGEVYVYRRAGQPCHVCGTPIEHQVMEGRNLFWCPGCQR